MNTQIRSKQCSEESATPIVYETHKIDRMVLKALKLFRCPTGLTSSDKNSKGRKCMQRWVSRKCKLEENMGQEMKVFEELELHDQQRD